MRKYRVFLLVGFILVAVFLLAGCAIGGNKPVAVVNGETITRAQLSQRIALLKVAYHQDLDDKMMEKDILEEMINERLLFQEASRQGFTADSAQVEDRLPKLRDALVQSYGSEEAFQEAVKKYKYDEGNLRQLVETQLTIAPMIDKVVGGVDVSEEEIVAYFNAHKEELKEPDQIRASHILVKTQEEAVNIRQQLVNGADFAELAKQYSIDDATKESGGDLGYFKRGDMVPQFDQVAFSLQVGEISQPVQTDYGYHIIKVTDKKAAEEPTLEGSREKIKEELLQKKKYEKYQAFLKDLTDNATIERKI